jgi:peptidoglycan/LPS O-acetylase OafA/YrhL
VATVAQRADTSNTGFTLDYNPKLDTLRALAAIAVLAFHYSGWFGWGWLGVPFFFVLSGYLITSILLESKARVHSFGTYCANFFRRRALRLIPVYALFVAGLMIFGLATHHSGALPSALPYLFTYTFNYALDYVQPPYGHLWSLSVEWQFYLLWPVAVWFLSEANLRRVLVALVCVAPLLRLTSFQWFQLHHFSSGRSAEFTYLMTWTHLDALALGALLAWRPVREFASSKRIIAAAALAVFCAGVMVSALGWYRGFAGQHEALVTLGYPYTLLNFREYVWGYSLLDLFFATVVAGACSTNSFVGIFRWRWLRHLGKVSYGFYLFHYPVILMTSGLLTTLRPLFGESLFSTAWEKLTPSLGLVLSVAFTFLFAHLSYQFWERRFLKLIPRLKRAIDVPRENVSAGNLAN